MILGELKIFEKILKQKIDCFYGKYYHQRKLGKQIELETLERIQVFHVTHSKNRASILQYGLLCKGIPDGQIISYPPRIYVSSTYKDVAFDYVNYEEVDVWSFYVRKRELYEDHVSSYNNHYFLSNDIPWYELELLETRL